MSDSVSLRRSAMSALVWSAFQNWGGKIVSLVVFVLLARLLDPTAFGLASSAFLVLMLLNYVAEFGMGDALVQRPGLSREDVNLPFYISMFLSVLLACCLAYFSQEIASLMGVLELGPYLMVAAAIGPLMTLSAIQDALYRREMKFKPLALRTVSGVAVGGIVGVLGAFAGWGTWALIAQYGVQMLFSVVWLWSRPVWTPSRTLRPQTAGQLGRFGLNVLTTYLLDFATGKSVDLIILLKFGPAALGLYAVSSRLYLLLLQLLQATISSVGLTMLSRVSSDIPRMQKLYQRTASLSSLVGTPIFFGLAALAPEVNHILFGSKWSGAEFVMVPLLLIGGVHCVQFLNIAYLTALGRPHTLVRLGVYKAAIVLPLVYFVPLDDVWQTVALYCFALLLSSPLSFGATLKALELPWSSLARTMLAPVIAAGIAFGVTVAVRVFGGIEAPNEFVGAILYGLVFSLSYVVAVACLAFRLAKETIVFALGTGRRAK